MDFKNLEYELNQLGKESVKFLKDVLIRNNKVATGDLINSIDYQVIEESNGFILNILANETFNFVDEGRRPGKQPPVKPILSWIRNKHIKFNKMSDNPTAFIIARSIGKKGIKPLRLKKQLMNDFLDNRAKLLMTGAAQKDVQVMIDELFKNK
jgi:hypothetical protein